MTTHNLPEQFEHRPYDGGKISGRLKGDLLVITIVDQDSYEEGYIELGDAQMDLLFVGLTALLLAETEMICVDVGDKLRDRDAESIIFTANGRGTRVDFHIWGDPTKLGEPGGGSAFSVYLTEPEALAVYLRLIALALRRGNTLR